MNRRSFLSTLLAAPVVAWAVPKVKAKPLGPELRLTNADEARQLAEQIMMDRWMVPKDAEPTRMFMFLFLASWGL